MAEKNTRSILKNIKSKITKFDKKAEKPLEDEEDSEFEYLIPQDPEEEEEEIVEEKPVEVGAEGILEFEVDGKNHYELGVEAPSEPVDEISEELLASKAKEDELLGNSDVPAEKKTETKYPENHVEETVNKKEEEVFENAYSQEILQDRGVIDEGGLEDYGEASDDSEENNDAVEDVSPEQPEEVEVESEQPAAILPESEDEPAVMPVGESLEESLIADSEENNQEEDIDSLDENKSPEDLLDLNVSNEIPDDEEELEPLDENQSPEDLLGLNSLDETEEEVLVEVDPKANTEEYPEDFLDSVIDVEENTSLPEAEDSLASDTSMDSFLSAKDEPEATAESMDDFLGADNIEGEEELPVDSNSEPEAPLEQESELEEDPLESDLEPEAPLEQDLELNIPSEEELELEDPQPQEELELEEESDLDLEHDDLELPSDELDLDHLDDEELEDSSDLEITHTEEELELEGDDELNFEDSDGEEPYESEPQIFTAKEDENEELTEEQIPQVQEREVVIEESNPVETQAEPEVEEDAEVDYESELAILEKELEEQEKKELEKTKLLQASVLLAKEEVSSEEDIELELEKEMRGFTAPAPKFDKDIQMSAYSSSSELKIDAPQIHDAATEVSNEAPEGDLVRMEGKNQNPAQNILHDDTIMQATDSVKKLIDAKNVVSGISNFAQSPALRDLAAEMIEPKLEKWLNDNLAELVESVVREEIKKILPKE
jgi:cell pole-organizing protein PopZ